MTDAELIANTTLRPCLVGDVSVLLYYGEMVYNDVRAMLGPLPRGAAACVIGWERCGCPDEYHLIVGIPRGAKVDWYKGRLKT